LLWLVRGNTSKWGYKGPHLELGWQTVLSK
jgi:hypothetical protein